MHNQYGRFLEQYKNVVRLGADMLLTDEEPDRLQRTPPLNTELFLEHLYEPRLVEKILRELLRQSSDLICFVGPQGAGKTSVAMKVIRDLNMSKRHLTFVVYIDIRAELAQRAFKTGSTHALTEALRATIIDYYMEQLFPLQYDDPSRRLDLWTFLLDELKEVEKPFKIFHSFRRIREVGLRLFERYRAAKERKGHSLRDWLEARHTSDEAVIEVTQMIDETVDVAHLAYAARFIHGYERQILWMDNIDALPEGLQPEVIHILRGFHNLASAYLSSVVAVREENIFRYHEPESNAPPFHTRVLLEMPRDAANRPYYPAVDVPVIKLETLQNIVRRRMAFARHHQENLHREEMERQPNPKEVEERLEEADSSKEKEVLEDYLEEIGEEREVVEPITEERFQLLSQVSEMLLKTLDRERAVYLANNSLRDLLFIHRDCLGIFLRGLDQNEGDPSTILEYEEWYLATLFLSWMRNTMRVYQVSLYDVIDGVNDWHAGGRKDLGCFLPHLVITCVWNLTRDKRVEANGLYSSPRVGEVLERLELLGFEERRILRELHALSGGKVSLIGIRAKRRLAAPEKIKSELQVYATFRGKCLVGHTSCSFGYLCGCLRMQEVEGNEGGGILEHAKIRATDEWGRRLLPHLCDLAEMHYAGLKRICSAGTLGEGWLARYLRYFGVPQVEPYRRGSERKGTIVGRKIGGYRRALQLETILASVERYVGGKSETVLRKVRKLQHAFMEAVNDLERDPSICGEKKGPGFRGELGLPARE